MVDEGVRRREGHGGDEGGQAEGEWSRRGEGHVRAGLRGSDELGLAGPAFCPPPETAEG